MLGLNLLIGWEFDATTVPIVLLVALCFVLPYIYKRDLRGLDEPDEAPPDESPATWALYDWEVHGL